MTSIAAKIAGACASVALITSLSPPAHAQAGGLGPSDFVFSTERYDPVQATWVRQSAADQQYFFNRARCECVDSQGDGGASNETGTFRIAIAPAVGTAQKIAALLAANGVATGTGRLYAGNPGVNCLALSPSDAAFATSCTNLLDPNNPTAEFPLTVFTTQLLWESPPIPVARLFAAFAIPGCATTGTCDRPAACNLLSTTETVQFWAQTGAGSFPDSSNLGFALNLAGGVVLAPALVTVDSGNEALLVRWAWPVDPTSVPNLLGVHLFCQRGTDSQVFSNGTFNAAYVQSAMLCPDIAPAAAQTDAFANESPAYLCSDLLPLTSSSYRMTGLQNGVFYGVGIAAVDKLGNITPIASTQVVYQAPGAGVSVDGGTAEPPGSPPPSSGGCALAEGRSVGGLASVGLVGLCLLFFARKRRDGR